MANSICRCDKIDKERRVITLHVPARNVYFSFTKVKGRMVYTGSFSYGSICPNFSDMPKDIKKACYKMAGAIYKKYFEKTLE